ncbi:LysR substrate-binding domain-containing protein [Aliivibrio kagoshimensis]|uniref:LysR substrate-binding domain-containing protein n=1 Tax=Aliivibrio kagoshimensis TaxID=2910230 RepID=UPI003D119991
MSALPPFKSLVFFERAAYFMNFTKAADELCVTPPAISQQIKKLEENLGVKLFTRLPGKLELTTDGATLYESVAQSINIIRQASDKIKSKGKRSTITISLTPALSTQWLVLRLHKFWKQHPDIDLRLHHSLDFADLTSGEADLAIRWCDGQQPGLISKKLLSGDLAPVCSPLLLSKGVSITTPSDLINVPILHEDSRNDWNLWGKQAKVNINTERGPIIDDSSSLMKSVMEGHGVALGRISVLEDDIKNGRLIQLFDKTLAKGKDYYLVYPEGQDSNINIVKLHEFFMQSIS